MSRANAQVKFPDGTIRYGIYNGTTDHYWEYLFESSEEAWKEWDKYYKNMGTYKPTIPYWDAVEGTYYDVEIADDYGGGDCYIGRASIYAIYSPLNVDHLNRKNPKGGLPDWWKK